jgi:hypothetical protein
MKFAHIVTVMILLITCHGCGYNADFDENEYDIRTMNTQELIDYIKADKKGKSFFAADWCGGSSLTYKNIVLHELSDYDYEIFYFGSKDGMQDYLNDSVKVIWLNGILNVPLNHKNKLKKILKALDENYEYQWVFPLSVHYVDTRLIQF